MSAPVARLNRRHQELVREKIQSALIVNRLEDHILNGLEMTKSQVSAALGLLKKCVPDLTTMTVAGDDENPLTMVHKVERVLVRANAKD